MERITLPVYRFFRRHKVLMYLILAVTTVVFALFGSRLTFEEDMTKLLPSSGKSEEALVFGNLKIKDKVFLQITAKEGESVDYMTLASCMDSFMDSLEVMSLYRIDADLAINALDYALTHVPSFVSEDMYPLFDKAIADIDSTMVRNTEAVLSDMTGAATQAVCSDPFGLRYTLLPEGGLSGNGFTVVDGHLFSPDSTVALAFLSPDFKSFDSASTTVLIKELRRRADAVTAAHPEVEILMHGAPVRSADNSGSIKRDIYLTIGISLVIILIVLFICFRSFSLVWQNLLPVTWGTLFSLACIWFMQKGMSLMALGIGSVVLGVALSYCLHVIIHQRYVGDRERMLKDESTPVFLGCLTTIGAFLGLLFTKSALLRDFGLFATFNLVGTTFFALVFLPHFLKESETGHNEKAFKLISRINNYPYDRCIPLVVILTAVILVGIIFTHKVGFDNNLKHIGYESDNLHRSENLYAEKNLGNNLQRHYAVAAQDLDEALENNASLANLLDSLKGEGLIASYTPLIPKLFQSTSEQQARIEAWNRYWSPEKVAEARKALVRAARRNGLSPSMFDPFFAMVSAPYEPGNLYETGIIPEELMANFIEYTDGKYMIFNTVQLSLDERPAVDSKVVAMPGAVVVDPFYYTGNMIDIVHEDFNTTLLISSLFVLLVLLLAFRNILVSLLAFLPMFLSWYVVQGWMAIFGLQFNLINIIISTFIFGIGVDYSIFVMQGLLSSARGDDSSLLEYHKGAIFFSAFVLLVVILSMLVARHPAVHSIGLCTLIGMTSTILITYTLQPLLFRWMMKLPYFRKSLKINVK